MAFMLEAYVSGSSCPECELECCFGESPIPNCTLMAVQSAVASRIAAGADEGEVARFAQSLATNILLPHIVADVVAAAEALCLARSRSGSDAQQDAGSSSEGAELDGDAWEQWGRLRALAGDSTDLGAAQQLYARAVSEGADPRLIVSEFDDLVATQQLRGVHPRFRANLLGWLEANLPRLAASGPCTSQGDSKQM